MPVQSRSAYYRTNIAWPVGTSANGLAQVSLAERFESAIRHLLITPRGSLYYAHDYGSNISQLRTQGMNQDLISIALAQLRQATAKYIPDIQIVDLAAEIQEDDQKLRINATWIIRDATPMLHGELAGHRATSVLI